MAFEIETKVLDIDKKSVLVHLHKLGAKLKSDTRLFVDWFHNLDWFTKDGLKEGEDPWFLRVRSDSSAKCEITWKARSQITGIVGKHKEINIPVPSHEDAVDLFTELGLKLYAHQEKDRTTLVLNDWQFDIDQYPGMPAFLEIEGESEESINKAIELLGLEANRTWPKGERTLIQEVYGLDWYNMKF